jgi:hypothetical protein
MPCGDGTGVGVDVTQHGCARTGSGFGGGVALGTDTVVGDGMIVGTTSVGVATPRWGVATRSIVPEAGRSVGVTSDVASGSPMIGVGVSSIGARNTTVGGAEQAVNSSALNARSTARARHAQYTVKRGAD